MITRYKDYSCNKRGYNTLSLCLQCGDRLIRYTETQFQSGRKAVEIQKRKAIEARAKLEKMQFLRMGIIHLSNLLSKTINLWYFHTPYRTPYAFCRDYTQFYSKSKNPLISRFSDI